MFRPLEHANFKLRVHCTYMVHHFTSHKLDKKIKQDNIKQNRSLLVLGAVSCANVLNLRFLVHSLDNPRYDLSRS